MPRPVRKKTLAVLVAVCAIHAVGIFLWVPGSPRSPENAGRPVQLTLLTPEAPTKAPATQVAAATPALTTHRNVVKQPTAESPVPRQLETGSVLTAGNVASVQEKSTAKEPVIAPGNDQSLPTGSPLKEPVQTAPQGASAKQSLLTQETAGVEPPSAAADYLHNPPPAYPSLSLRLQEQGQVVHRVMIGLDGKAINAQLLTSSGSERLDRAAREAVMQWRYVPGKKGGNPTIMSVDVPITWQLK